jgi:DNA-binding LacI/PurR family transcriptional regulator
MNPPSAKKNRPTSRDVASLAGVSQSTVSRVFNTASGAGVKPAIQKKVIFAAKKLGYQPNLVARGMISGKTNVIGLVVGEGIGPFYHSVIFGMVEQIQKKGMQCLVFKIDKREKIGLIIDKVLQFQVDAIVVTAPAMSRDIEKVYQDISIPVILFNRVLSGTDMPAVFTDPVKGGWMAARYLYKKGHRNIGYMHYENETMEETEKRIGFMSYLRECGIHHVLSAPAAYSYEAGYDAAVRMLTGPKRPSAVFCTSDLMALGMLDAARCRLGIRIPEDLSVLGYDDIASASWKAYGLDTIAQPVGQLVEKTVELLLMRLDGNECSSTEIELTLVERGSVIAV